MASRQFEMRLGMLLITGWNAGSSSRKLYSPFKLDSKVFENSTLMVLCLVIPRCHRSFLNATRFTGWQPFGSLKSKDRISSTWHISARPALLSRERRDLDELWFMIRELVLPYSLALRYEDRAQVVTIELECLRLDLSMNLTSLRGDRHIFSPFTSNS